MDRILDNLKFQVNRSSTRATYLGVWRNFNKFLLRLDGRPRSWEHGVTLYCTHLCKLGRKSSTIKSYVSAIKFTLVADDYPWSDRKILLSTLTRVCKAKNDVVHNRFPIRISLLEQLLFKLEQKYAQQPYLELLFKNMFCFGYYGLMRIGEIAYGKHTVKAKDIYVGDNKDKILLLLHSSKTHGRESRPQTIKIEANEDVYHPKTPTYCPFRLARKYLRVRGDYVEDEDQLFVFSDQSPVMPAHVRSLLKQLLADLNLNPDLYDTHSFRIGRASDLSKAGHSLDYIKQVGRWKSNAVYRYLRTM